MSSVIMHRVLCALAPRAGLASCAAPRRHASKLSINPLKVSLTPYSKRLKNSRQEVPLRRWPSLSDATPSVAGLKDKFLRHAARIGRLTGAADEIAAFDAAAASWPTSTPIYLATLLERPAVIMRQPEEWEAAFLDLKCRLEDLNSKPYPSQLLDMLTASSRVVEGFKSEGGGSLSAYYDATSTSTGEGGDVSSLAISSRTSSADDILDFKSIDRALDSRLVLLVKQGATWTLPSCRLEPGTPLVQCAASGFKSVSGGEVQVHYYGAAPVGHSVQVYDPQVQVETGAYGCKIFYYRAEILSGRFKSSELEHVWVTRDEAEAFLPRPQFKYMHAMMGGSGGEEAKRASGWRDKLKSKGWSTGQGSGRRAAAGAGQQFKLKAYVTAEQRRVGALPWGDDKRTQLKSQVAAWNARARVESITSAATAARMAMQPAASRAAAAAQQVKAGQE